MRTLGRILLVVLVVAAVLGIVVGVFRFLVVPRSFPQTEGELRLPGLDDVVEVYRDSYGVPHIYASTEHDLFMAQGFVQAQDRFWQMEFWRRVGHGRLAEVVGEPVLDQDVFIRTVGWHRTAALEAELLGESERALLAAFSEGVNHYLRINRGKLGLEFTVLGLTGSRWEPEPWSAVDTLVWAKVMAWDLGGQRTVELTRAHVAARLGAPAVAVLMPPYRADYPVIVPETASETSLQAVPGFAFEGLLFGGGPQVGSNSWVIAGQRTATGAPMLANDPHLGIRLPSIWYEVGLHCEPQGPDCPLNLVGVTLSGVPGVIIGHNDRIAWGATNLGPDVVDFFIERTNPDNPDQYEFQGEWNDMDIVREEIRVAGRDQPVIVDVRLTRHGPIINDVAGGVGEDWQFGWQPLALSWTALEPGTIVRSLILLNRAQNWEEFRQALSYWDVPSQNFIYADVEGNIGYQSPGRIPIRATGDGSFPVPGWSGEYEWVDTIPFEDLPSVLNPDLGYLVTANNAVVGPDYPYFLSMDWDVGYRARRITELIEADESLSLVDLQALQRDSSPLYAQDVLHHVLALNPTDNRQSQALDILRAWDGRAVRDSAGAAIFEAFSLELIKVTFTDELGEQLLGRTRGYLLMAVLDLLDDPNSTWFDDRQTAPVEDREAMLSLALENAVDALTERLGRNMSRWRWGDLHTSTFVNLPLGASGIGPIEWIFNRGPVETDGTGGAVNNTAYNLGDPFTVVSLPSYRQLIDLGDFGRSLTMHTTGQSGHAFHPHYDDMIDPWRNFQYHPMLWARSQVESATQSLLLLRP